MPPNRRGFILTIILAAFALLGCNLPIATATPNSTENVLAGTLAALQTRAVMTATAQDIAGSTETPLPPTLAKGQTSGSQNPVTVTDTLCWAGPGSQFEVVSAILKGTSVQLLGKATIPGWFIVRNPIYFDPCWIQASALQIDPTLDLSGLPLFNPPSTPTPTSEVALTNTVTPVSSTNTTTSPTSGTSGP